MGQNIRLDISYDGTDYFGWQVQVDSQDSVQSRLQNALSEIYGEPITVHGSGRTDRGVHAICQTTHFYAPRQIQTIDLAKAIQSSLPKDITIIRAFEAPEEFHARYSAIEKTYRYQILNADRPSALETRFCWWMQRPLNLNYLNEAAQLLIGTKDFKSFQTAGTTITQTIRTITQAEWSKSGDKVSFEITGNGFLKQMVRNIVGTLIQMHNQERPIELLTQIIEAKDRTKALTTAPPHGLFLVKVIYPTSLDNECRQI